MEGQSFEKHGISQSETGPGIDVESVLERGEIGATEMLEGHAVIDVVRIKDDGIGLFKPEGEEIWLGVKGRNRVMLELLAYKLDKTLGFNLVPATVSREIQGKKGALQKFISQSSVAVKLRNWREIVDTDELRRAAIFDYIINAQDRGLRNFLVNPATGKIWLIDHDSYMFSDVGETNSEIFMEFLRRNSPDLPEAALAAITKVPEFADAASNVAGEELKAILASVKKRAETLLEKREILA